MERQQTMQQRMEEQLSEFYDRNFELIKHYMIFVSNPEEFEKIVKKEKVDPAMLKRKATWNRFKRSPTNSRQDESIDERTSLMSSIKDLSPVRIQKARPELPGMPKKHTYEKRVDKSIMKMYFMKEFGHVMKYLMSKYCVQELCPRQKFQRPVNTSKHFDADKDSKERKARLYMKSVSNEPPKLEVRLKQPFVDHAVF